MKRATILLLLALLVPVFATAQDTVKHVEVVPVYPGGEKALYADVAVGGLVYPAEAKENGIEGEVIVQFIVEKDGTVDHVRVVKDEVGYGAGEDLVNRVRNLKKFTPGTVDGVPARCQFQLPVTYSLSTEKPKRTRSKWIRMKRAEAKK